METLELITNELNLNQSELLNLLESYERVIQNEKK